MKRKETRYFSWIMQSKSTQEKLKGWLADNGADVFDGKGLKFNEVIKFKIGGAEGVLWHTGYANQMFISTVVKYRKVTA